VEATVTVLSEAQISVHVGQQILACSRSAAKQIETRQRTSTSNTQAPFRAPPNIRRRRPRRRPKRFIILAEEPYE